MTDGITGGAGRSATSPAMTRWPPVRSVGPATSKSDKLRGKQIDGETDGHRWIRTDGQDGGIEERKDGLTKRQKIGMNGWTADERLKCWLYLCGLCHKPAVRRRQHLSGERVPCLSPTPRPAGTSRYGTRHGTRLHSAVPSRQPGRRRPRRVSRFTGQPHTAGRRAERAAVTG